MFTPKTLFSVYLANIVVYGFNAGACAKFADRTGAVLWLIGALLWGAWILVLYPRLLEWDFKPWEERE